MKYRYKPKTKEELIKAIKKEIYEVQGTKDSPNWQADLNCIDTSNVTDMSELFSDKYGLEKFNGDISTWNTKNVKNMKSMFNNSQFNGDISKWNVSNVKDMSWMFYKSKFNGDISKWNVNNVKDMQWMFSESRFNQNINNWDVSNVTDMKGIFDHSKFNQDISNWNVSNVKNMSYMFKESQFNQDISNWNVSNVEYMLWMFENSKFNGDIGSWPLKLKKNTKLKNISVSSKYNRLPDKIVSHQTVKNILQNKKILYEPETIAKLFAYSLKNNDKNFDFKTVLKNYLIEKKENYKRKGYKSEIIKKLILNDIADILKHLKDKKMQDKFMEIIAEKNGKESDIDIVS